MTRNAATEVLGARRARDLARGMGGSLLPADIPLEPALAMEKGREYGFVRVEEFIETDPPRKLELPDGLDWKDLEAIDDRILEAANDAGSPVRINPNDGSNT